MKKLSFILFSAVMLVSCGGKDSYTVETFYSNNKGNGDTTLVTEKDNISAESDSAAYAKAQDKFNSLMGKSGDKNGMPVKFTVRDHDGVIVAGPGLDTNQVEKQMYPNQKPSTGN